MIGDNIDYLIKGESDDRHNKIQISYCESRNSQKIKEVSRERQKDIWYSLSVS